MSKNRNNHSDGDDDDDVVECFGATQNSVDTEKKFSHEFSLEKLITMAEENIFPKKTFEFGGLIKKYTPVTHFFGSDTVFKKFHDTKTKISFNCRVCTFKVKCEIGKFTALNRHLQTHLTYKATWYDKYQKHLTGDKRTLLTNEQLELVKYFITSNESLSQLNNIHLLYFLKPAFNEKPPSQNTFRRSLLPNVIKLLRSAIESKLDDAETVCLIVDIWTNKRMIDFIALGAVVTNKSFERELFVIDIIPMSGRHTAENVRIAVKQMVENYDFDKSKIFGKCFKTKNFVFKTQNNIFLYKLWYATKGPT